MSIVHKTAILDKKYRVQLSEKSNVGPYSCLYTGDGLIVIENAIITSHVCMFGHFNIYIGNYVLIAPNVVIATGNHNYKQTVRPMINCSSDNSLTVGPIHNGYNIYIDDDVWIGANSVITDGVMVGGGAVIGAGSVITKNIEPFDIVVGNPQKVIGNRKLKEIFYK